MAKTVKQFIHACIERTRGDDLYRAQNEFRSCTAAEMTEEYGVSGKTRQQILDGYIAHGQECDAAQKIIESLL